MKTPLPILIALIAVLALVTIACSDSEPEVITVVVTATPAPEQPTNTPVPTPEPSATALPTSIASPTPNPTSTTAPVPTHTPVPVDTPAPTAPPAPEPIATDTPTPTPTPTPVVEYYRKSVIQILENEAAIGSAVVIGKDGNTIIVATALHVMNALPSSDSITIGGTILEDNVAARYELLYEQAEYDFALAKLSGCTCEDIEPAEVVSPNTELPSFTSVQSFGYSGGVDGGALRGAIQVARVGWLSASVSEAKGSSGGGVFLTSTQKLVGIITDGATLNPYVSGITLAVDMRYFAEEIEAAISGRTPQRVPRMSFTRDELVDKSRVTLEPGRWWVQVRIQLRNRRPCTSLANQSIGCISSLFSVGISRHLRPSDGPRTPTETVFERVGSIATWQTEERWLLSEVLYLSALHESRVTVDVTLPSWAIWSILIVRI